MPKILNPKSEILNKSNPSRLRLAEAGAEIQMSKCLKNLKIIELDIVSNFRLGEPSARRVDIRI